MLTKMYSTIGIERTRMNRYLKKILGEISKKNYIKKKPKLIRIEE